MICKACNKVSSSTENEDCFEKCLDMLRKHYAYYKNAILQRDLELKQVKERNEKLNKALHLLQKNQSPFKRFKSQHSSDQWLGNNYSQEECVMSDISLTDDEPTSATNLNVALNSEQLFDTSALNQTKIDSLASSEIVQSPRVKYSPKRNKQCGPKRCLKDSNINNLKRSISDWHTKERNCLMEKSWATKFLQPEKVKATEDKLRGERKQTVDKRLCLSLKKNNPSKIKQSLLPFDNCKGRNFRESDVSDDVIDASPIILKKTSTSWTHRSGQSYNSSSSSSNIAEKLMKKDDTNKLLDDIVFDFSPTKQTDLTLNTNFSKVMEPKQLKLNSDISKDCMSLSSNNLVISTDKSDSSSVVILTPATQDIIFVDDISNLEPEIDAIDLLADLIKQGGTDNLEKLKKYESKCIQKNQQNNGQIEVFKKPQNTSKTDVLKIKQEKNTQELLLKNKEEAEEENPSCSKSGNHIKPKRQNPLFSSEDQDTEDEDFMPKPLIIKQESESFTHAKYSIKQRFNIDCRDCEKLINFLNERLTDAQIQQHLDKCKHHNDMEIMQENTPKDFWNPFILSFQDDDPRNEVLIDDRFKDNKK